jgi:hypothetical protein
MKHKSFTYCLHRPAAYWALAHFSKEDKRIAKLVAGGALQHLI